MGMDRADYIVYGWQIPKKEISDFDVMGDKALPYIEGHPGITYTIVPGEPIVFGKRIASTTSDEGWRGYTELLTPIMNISEKETIEKYKEVFGKEPKTKPTLFIFSNWS